MTIWYSSPLFSTFVKCLVSYSEDPKFVFIGEYVATKCLVTLK